MSTQCIGYTQKGGRCKNKVTSPNKCCHIHREKCEEIVIANHISSPRSPRTYKVPSSFKTPETPVSISPSPLSPRIYKVPSSFKTPETPITISPSPPLPIDVKRLPEVPKDLPRVMMMPVVPSFKPKKK